MQFYILFYDRTCIAFQAKAYTHEQSLHTIITTINLEVHTSVTLWQLLCRNVTVPCSGQMLGYE